MRPGSLVAAWRPPRPAVVLSGGANLGAFQVGVIDVLARAGIEPDLLVGTSVGVVNAGFWAFPGFEGRHQTPCGLARGEPIRPARWPPRPRAATLLRGRHLFADAGLVRLLRTTLPPGARVEDAGYPLNIVVTRALEGTREVIRTGNCPWNPDRYSRQQASRGESDASASPRARGFRASSFSAYSTLPAGSR
jgi:predicted acylesterase/phospholipase RssA